MVVVLSVLTALVVGAVLWLVGGPVQAVAAGVLVLVVGGYGQAARGGRRQVLAGLLAVALLAAGLYGVDLGLRVHQALTTVDGPVDPVDPATLAAAEDKLQLDEASTFRVELTEAELQAVIQDGLASSGDVPLRRVDIDLRGATQDLGFVAAFKARDVQATGTATVEVDQGRVALDLGQLDFDGLAVPGVAAGAVQSVLGAVTDLNAALAEQQAAVQHIEIGDDVLVVIGSRATPDVLTSGELLAAIQAQAAGGLDAVDVPAERLGPGRLAGTDEPGSPLVMVLGDSLAAGVGVEDLRDSFASRFHRHVADADGVDYGLVNLGVPGETSTTFLADGQLAAAEARLAAEPAAYVVVDIGANDLLGHLTAPACVMDLASPGCQERIGATLDTYRDNVAEVLQRLVDAAGDATVLLLQVYNPFSLGLGESEQERQSSAIVASLNEIAAQEALTRGVLVADAFTPMLHTTAVTTHMLDPDPDIHPTAIGHDILAAALVDAL